MISERAFSKSFASFWQELLPLLTPRFVALFNEAYEKPLLDEAENSLCAVDLGKLTRADIVAEFAFRGARLLHAQGLKGASLLEVSEIRHQASREAFSVIQKYEGQKPASPSDLTEDELLEGVRLANQYRSLYSTFRAEERVEFCPAFSGAGFLNAAEGDLGIGDTLIEVKTTTRRVAGKDIRQLLTYLALDASANRFRWSHIGIFNPRRATFHRAEVDALVLRLSGGKPRSDVLAELIDFVEVGGVVLDGDF